MRGWLTPLGTEGPGTYWLRRGLVLLVAALLVGGIVWGAIAATRPSGDPTEAVPAASTPTATATTPEEQASAPATPAASTPAAPATTAASAAPAPTTPAAPAEPTACDPAALRLTVAGAPRVKSGEDEALTLSVINGGKAACVLELSSAKYELKVTSGSDLIWTTAHCGQWVPAVTKTLKPEEAHEWTTTWNTRRSKAECTTTGDYLKPGTYVVRAAYGAKTSDGLVVRLDG